MTAERPLVAVLVGTDHHPFDRLLAWVSALAADGRYRFHVQHGSTTLPEGLTGAPMLGVRELEDLVREADAVVTHAGPGCIMDARQQGHVPVVVPRDPSLGEHVDGHQQRFVRTIRGSGMILTARDADELAAQIDTAVAARREPGPEGVRTAVLTRFEALVDRLVAS